MNRPQRLRHKIFWIALAILLPLGFIAAVRVIPQDTPVNKIEVEE